MMSLAVSPDWRHPFDLHQLAQPDLGAVQTPAARAPREIQVKGLYASLNAVPVPERMPAAMFVSFMVSAIVAGKSEQIWKELADTVA